MWPRDTESDGDPNLLDRRITEIPIVEQIKGYPIPLMKNEMVRSFCSPFFIKKVDCEEVMAALSLEITKSLNNVDKTKVDLPMLNTHVSRTPNGLERGRCLAVDFLGDEHKLAIVTFSSQLRRPHVDVATFKLPNQYLSCSFGDLFEYLATTVEEFLTSRGLANRLLHACLSLPFAINNAAINSGEILFISKSFKFRHRSGTELLRTFQRHLDRKAVKVKCVAIVNDCVSVLEACAVDEADCAASFTLNSGVNAVYQEKLSNIRRDETFHEDAKSVLINTELGGFGDGGCLKRFITEFDKRLDRISTAPGLHTFEKFVSGENLGELVRQVLKLLTERGQLFGGEWPASLRDLRSFPASFLCEIDRDPPHLFYSTEFLLREDLKIYNLTPEDIHIVRYVCSAVTYRSACLSAAAAVTILKRLNRLRVTLAVEGYMFRKHPTFYKQMLTMMADLMPKHMTFRIKLPEEGYSVGSGAIVALYKDLVD